MPSPFSRARDSIARRSAVRLVVAELQSSVGEVPEHVEVVDLVASTQGGCL